MVMVRIRKLKYENGAHRVQRVPETESGGRIHTSTATVAVFLKQKKLKLRFMKKISVSIHLPQVDQVDKVLTRRCQLFV